MATNLLLQPGRARDLGAPDHLSFSVRSLPAVCRSSKDDHRGSVKIPDFTSFVFALIKAAFKRTYFGADKLRSCAQFAFLTAVCAESHQCEDFIKVKIALNCYF